VKIHIPLEVEHPEDTYTEVEYVVDASLEGTARWLEVESIDPAPPSSFVRDQLLAIAERTLNDAIEAALDAAEYGRAR